MSSIVDTKSIKRLSETKSVRLSGALIVQKGCPVLISAVPAEDVVRQAKVDIYHPDGQTGYQREPSSIRVHAAAQYYEEGGRMPNPLLANIREVDFQRVQVTVTSGSQDDYEAAIEDESDWVGSGYIEFPKDLPLWVYDGQHRAGGIKELLEKNDDFKNFPVPMSITLGLRAIDEMKEFYEVNTNAKSVKTDLAWELLRQMAKEDPDLAEALELSGKDWTARGIDIARALNQLDGPWKDRIQAPNQQRVRTDKLIIAEAEFVRSLRPILDMALFSKADADVIARIIDAYWKGIAKVLPEPFESGTSPKEWAIQKGSGVVPLHRVLPRVIEVVRARGGRLADPNAYADVLKQLPELSGEVADEEGDRRLVKGSDFWRAGYQGVAGAYTGEAGRRRLYVIIQALLPKPSQEIQL